MIDLRFSVEEFDEMVFSEVDVSGRFKKFRSYRLNGSSGGKKKKFIKGGGYLNLKVDGFVIDYSDSDIEIDVEEDDRKRSSIGVIMNDDFRVLGGVRE